LPNSEHADNSANLRSSRRFFLGRGAAAFSGLAIGATIGAAIPLPSTATASAHAATPASADGDAEIIALSAEVLCLNEIANDIAETRIDPFHDKFLEIMRGGAHRRFLSKDERAELVERAFAFREECGSEAAIGDQAKVDEQAYAIYPRMMAIPCTTQAGRAAKVRALLIHVMKDQWRGPAGPLDWHREQAPALLGEFAGMSAEGTGRCLAAKEGNGSPASPSGWSSIACISDGWRPAPFGRTQMRTEATRSWTRKTTQPMKQGAGLCLSLHFWTGRSGRNGKCFYLDQDVLAGKAADNRTVMALGCIKADPMRLGIGDGSDQ
jgi:hypothetical protein